MKLMVLLIEREILDLLSTAVVGFIFWSFIISRDGA
jgi:hypothetical protein